MARPKKRSSKAGNQASPEPSAADEPSATPPDSRGTTESHAAAPQDEDKCPACKDKSTQDWNDSDKESWVRCDACKVWFHWRCTGEGELDVIDKWYCTPCREADIKRVITVKPPARKSTRKRTQRDYAGLNSGHENDPNRWLRMMQGKSIKADPFQRMAGSEVTVEWLETDPSALTEPIVIESADGLGMKMPEGLTVAKIAETLGESTPVEVIDVATQSNLPGWTLGKWAEYYDTEPAKRDKIRNVISLEVSGTELASQILPPRIVRELDWVERFWPATRKGRGHIYPKVQLYCLMGVADAWTDWHIDFAGSSVYYHILHGSKVFYFIRPTSANLAAYERWSGTEMQNHSWLGDLCDEVFKIELHTGNTMIIPTGWIHAVYTPADTLVFGGNFLHSYNVGTQLKVRDIEIATHVPKKFRFPYFIKLCWYAGEKYLRDLRAKEEFQHRVLESVESLADFLVSEVRTMERGTDHARKEAKEQVPSDRVKDAPALARELRWRVRLANGYNSDDDAKHRRKAIPAAVSSAPHHNGSTKKRKRVDEEGGTEETTDTFRHFKPRVWDTIVAHPVQREEILTKAERPAIDAADWSKEWVEWKDVHECTAGEAADAVIEQRRDIIVKVRRTEKGVERQRVERLLEEWAWTDGASATSAEELHSPTPLTNGHSTKVELIETVEAPMDVNGTT